VFTINRVNARTWSILGPRGTFGVAIQDAAPSFDDALVLSADLAVSSGLDRFRANYPGKFINVGIAEQNLIGIAAGLAKEGFNAFATSFAPFCSMRAHEQVRHHLGYMHQNVKVVGLSSGVSTGVLGNTHFGLEDIAAMRTIPGLTVIAPADSAEVVKAVQALLQFQGPAYLRLTGGMNNPMVYTQDYDFVIGKSIALREGADVAIFACGTMVFESLKAADRLKEQGLSASVIDMHTIKPLDIDAIEKACQTVSLIVTAEEHSRVGGLGGAIAEYLAGRGKAPLQLIIALPDAFGPVGDYQFLLQHHGLTGSQIASRIASALGIREPEAVLASIAND
jgi:transketolase